MQNLRQAEMDKEQRDSFFSSLFIFDDK